MFVFNDSEYWKGGMDSRLGKIKEVNGTQVSVSYSLRGSKSKVSKVSRKAQEIFPFCIRLGIYW